MTRDHYKGVPKNVDARVNSSGEIVRLGKKNIKPSSSISYRSDGEEAIFYVDAATGNDSNDGKSKSGAFKTLQRVFQEIRNNVTGLRQIINLSGTFEINEALTFPVVNAGQDDGLVVGSEHGPNNYYSEALMQLRADVELVQGVTVSGTTSDPDTDFTTVTVDEVLVPNAHVGQFLIGAGIYEHGAIVENTENTITIATDYTTFTGPVGIYKPGAEIISGDPNNFYNGATTIVTATTNWFISGIKFTSTDNSKSIALTILGPADVTVQQCTFAGIRIEGITNGGPTFDCCSFMPSAAGHNPSHIVRSCSFGSVQLRHSYYENLSFEWDTSWIIIYGAHFEACRDAVSRNHGTGGIVDVDKFAINNATGIGLRSRYRNRTTLANGRIDNSADHAIEIISGTHSISNVAGSGNGGFGCNITHGAQVAVGGVTTVSGTSGEVSLGGSGAVTWDSAPNTDVGAADPQFCRII